MKKWNQILAYCLLSLYGCVFLHSIIPHSHHSAAQIESQVISQEDNTTSWLSFLDELVHQHEHQEDNHESFDEYRNESEALDNAFDLESQVVFISFNFTENLVELLNEEIHLEDYLINFRERFSQSKTQRGPPVLIS